MVQEIGSDIDDRGDFDEVYDKIELFLHYKLFLHYNFYQLSFCTSVFKNRAFCSSFYIIFGLISDFSRYIKCNANV